MITAPTRAATGRDTAARPALFQLSFEHNQEMT